MREDVKFHIKLEIIQKQTYIPSFLISIPIQQIRTHKNVDSMQ